MVRCDALLFHSLYYEARGCNTRGYKVLYPLLRVEIPKLKGERVGDIPPGLLRPLSMEALHLQEDSDLCSRLTAKGDSLAKLAP